MTAPRVALAGSTGSIGTQTLEVLAAEPDRFELTALGASGRQLEAAGRPGRGAPPQGRGRGRRRRRAPSWPARLPAVRGAGRRRRPGQPGRGGRRGRQRRGRLRRPAGHPGHARGRPPPGAGQQGVADRRRPGRAAGPPHPGRRARAGRQRALRRPPVPAGQRHRRLGWPASCSPPAAGPFRGRSAAELAEVTIDDALAHPTWTMGPKITVDSSTLMNKGLEVIEAHELFGEPAGDAGVGIGFDQIDVVVHPQSIVHSMVEFTDAATIAQLSHARHAPAHRLRPGLPRPQHHAVRSHRLDRARPPRLRAARPRGLPLPRPGLRRRPHRRAPRRPGSAPPTRSPSRPSWPAASAGPRSPRSSMPHFELHDGTPAADVDDRHRHRSPRPRGRRRRSSRGPLRDRHPRPARRRRAPPRGPTPTAGRRRAAPDRRRRHDEPRRASRRSRGR